MTTRHARHEHGGGHPDGEEIDQTSPRWITAVHEAGHATAAAFYGARTAVCRIHPDDTTGISRHTAFGLAHAVVAVAGERATRLLLGTGGGSIADYADARAALARSGSHHSLAWVENLADGVLSTDRRDLLRTARQLYRTRGR